MSNPSFFAQLEGVGGHVSHLNGVIDALLEEGLEVEVVANQSASLRARQGLSLFDVPWNGSTLGRFFWAKCFLAQVRARCAEPGTAFVYLRYSRQFFPLLPGLKRSLWDIPLVLELNSFGAQANSPLARLEAAAIGEVDVAVCVSESLAQSFRALKPSAAVCQTVVVPNGVDLSRFAGLQEFHATGRRVARVGYVGTVKSGYGLDTLISAARRLDSGSARVQVVGTGPALASLKELATGAPVDFLGVVPFDDVPGRLAEMDVLVYPATAQNSFQSPIKLFEYLAAGRPIVAMRTEVTASILEHGVNALLVPIGDEAELARAIMRLLQDGALARRLAQGAVEAAKLHAWGARMDLMLGAIAAVGRRKCER